MKRTKQERIFNALFVGGAVLALIVIITIEIRKIELTAEVTETGALLTDTGALIALEMERSNRAYGFLLRMKSRESVRESFSQKQLERRRKLVAHQMECKDEMRRANRDTKLPTLTRCFRTQLTLHLESLRKERTYIENTMVGLTDAQKDQAVTALNTLVDAITTVIDGLDAGVYTSQEGLEEAKRNLMEKYWTPWWHARLKLHADRMLSWIAHFITRTDVTRGEDLPDEDREVLVSMSACLTDQESRLRAAMSSLDYEETYAKLKDAYEKIPVCLGKNPPPNPQEQTMEIPAE